MESPAGEAKERFPVTVALSILEHRIWLALREGALGEDETNFLREVLKTVLEEHGILGDPDRHPDRMWKDLMSDAEFGKFLSSLPAFVRMTDALDRLEEARKKRFAVASGRLALAWLDDLLLVPEADRRAWIRELAQWVSVKGFTEALEEGRTRFLIRLPSLSLPSVDPDLIRTGTQDFLWKTILTGRIGEDASDDDNPYARMDLEELMEARQQLRRDFMEKGIINREEYVRRTILVRDELSKFPHQPSGSAFFSEEDLKPLHNVALALLERHGECLGVLDEESARRYFSGARGAVKQWMEKVPDRQNALDAAFLFSWVPDQRREIGIWNIDMESLLGQPVYQKLLRDVLPLDAYAAWRQDRNERRNARTRALRDFAVARMDASLQLSTAQRERARAASLEYDEGHHSSLERLVVDNFPYISFPYIRLNPDLVESSPDAACMLIARELVSGPMTAWQRERLEALRKEWEE